MRTPSALAAIAALSLGATAIPSSAAGWIDNAYFVSSLGSTEALTHISLDAPAPWLLLDLSFVYEPTAYSGLEVIWFTADWWHESLGLRINDAFAGYAGAPSDKLWVPATNWAAVKATGRWTAVPHLHYFDCIMTYGVGVCREGQDPGMAASLEVVTRVVPEPATWALALSGLGLLALRQRRRD